MSEISLQAPQSGDTISPTTGHLVAYDLPVGTKLHCTAVPATGTGYSHTVTTDDRYDFHSGTFDSDLAPGVYTFTSGVDGSTTPPPSTATNVEVLASPRLTVSMSAPDLATSPGNALYMVTLNADLTAAPDLAVRVRMDTALTDPVSVINGAESKLWATLFATTTVVSQSVPYDPTLTHPIWHIFQVRYRYTDGGVQVVKTTRAPAANGILHGAPL